MKCSGRSVAVASRVTEIEEVLVATSVLSRQARAEFLEDFLLDRFVFGGRLDDEIAVLHVVERLGDANAFQRRRDLIVLDQAARRLAVHVLVDALQRLCQRLLVDVVEHHVEPGQRQDMRDAVAHLAGADDADAFNCHAR